MSDSSPKPTPAFVQENYPSLAAFGWNGFQNLGRGAVFVIEDGGGEAQLAYLPREVMVEREMDAVLLRLSAEYDPQTRIVLALFDENKELDAYVLGNADLPPPEAARILNSAL